MRSFVVLVCLISIACADPISQQQQNQAKSYIQQCKDEIGIDDNTAARVRGGIQDADTKKAQCFTKCFFKKTGFMDDKDQPQRDVIIRKLVDKHGFKEAEITEIIDKCIKEKGIDGCETAFKIFQCYRSNRIVKEKFSKPKTSNDPSGTTAAVKSVTPSGIPANGASSVATPTLKAVVTPSPSSSIVTPSPPSPTAEPKTSNNNANVGSSSNTPSLPPPLPLNIYKSSSN